MGIIKYVISIILIPVVLFLIYLGYRWATAPELTSFTYPTLTAVQRALDRSVEKVGDRPEPRKVVLFKQVPKDSEKHEARGHLKRLLDNSPKFVLLEEADAKEVETSKGILDYLKEKFFGTDKDRKYREIVGFDGYLWLGLNRDEDNDGAWASVKLHFFPKDEPDRSKILGEAKETYEKSFMNFDYLSHSIQETSWFGRLFIWIIIALGLPWASHPLAIRILALNSNRANALMITGLTLVSFISGFILTGLTFGGFFWFLGLLVMAALAGFWAAATFLFFEEKRK